MSRSIRTAVARTAAIVAAGIAGAVILAGCTAGTNQVIAPIMTDLNAIDGATVEVSVGNVIVLTGDDENPTAWTALIDDGSLLEFSPAEKTESAEFNPGLKALAEGTTDVTLSNTITEETVTFTVDITPAK